MSEVRITIRAFNFPDDYQPVIALWSTAGPGVHLGRSDTPEEIAKKLSRDPDLFLVALVGEQIVGTVLGGFDGRRGMVYHLAVAEEHRQNGIGSALMEVLEGRMRAAGCLRSYLLVTPENADAMHFYEQRGWQPMDLFIYAKDLD
jgi:ribosomal protein S18 acetylase RimI-like enzyme